MDARPSHADAKPSASYRDKSGICNLWATHYGDGALCRAAICYNMRMMKRLVSNGGRRPRGDRKARKA